MIFARFCTENHVSDDKFKKIYHVRYDLFLKQEIKSATTKIFPHRLYDEGRNIDVDSYNLWSECFPFTSSEIVFDTEVIAVAIVFGYSALILIWRNRLHVFFHFEHPNLAVRSKISSFHKFVVLKQILLAILDIYAPCWSLYLNTLEVEPFAG